MICMVHSEEKLVADHFGEQPLKNETKINSNKSCSTKFQEFISSVQNLRYLQDITLKHP